MSSFDKVVKNACKPKPNPPKQKYLDPIVAATWSDDGAVHDVCKALSPRFREPNAIIVFKALLVLHTMIRNGATDNVLSYLSSSDVLRLKNVSGGQWEGYMAPENLQNYANYLNARIRAYRDLKHDAIHVQSENNRDARLSMSLEEDARQRSKSEPPAPKAPTRSKTISGRKLRIMTVEKGLLRETKVVQKMIDTLVECRFYLDNLEDELTVTALRLLVKDLLILFQAGNEGVINVLEHYFEMSHVDAEQALAIYRHFCKQTEHVVEYLGVAKKLQNILNVPIPNLKHAPVSLVGALEEYLNDPNFEQNRIEYKTNKEAADRNTKNGKTASTSAAKSPSPKPTTSQAPVASTSSEPPKAESSQAMADFFSAIEEEQQTMFNPQTGSPTSTYFQQAAHNPFVQRQMTGFPSQPFVQPQMQTQPTGFIQPQMTAMPSFQLPQQPFSPFLQPQATGFLQPQTTGSNPFRQSALIPQATAASPFAQSNFGQPQVQFNGSNNPFPMQAQLQSPPVSNFASAPPTQQHFDTNPTSSNSFQPQPSSMSPWSAPQQISAPTNNSVPARPASTPITSLAFGNKPASPPPQPVKTHQTGSRNPFGVPAQPAPPVPKVPTLMELAMGINNNAQSQQQQVQPQQTGFNGFSAFGGSSAVGASSPSSQQGSGMSNIASSFSMNGGGNAGSKPEESQSFGLGLSNFGALSLGSSISPPTLPSQNTSTTSSGFSDSIFSSLSSQPTGATSNVTGATTPSITFSPPLKPQTTGFSGIKAFKPTSSFGASLLESLPPIPQSAPSTPGSQPSPTLNSAMSSPGTSSVSGNFGLSSQQTGMPSFAGQPTGATGFSAFGTGSGTGSTVGVGLRPQMTGAGGANPFRATMFATGAGTGGGGAFGGMSGSSSTPAFGGAGAGAGSGMGASLFTQNTGIPGAVGGMGASLFGVNGASAGGAFGPGNGAGAFGSSFALGGGVGGQDSSKKPQHNATASLI